MAAVVACVRHLQEVPVAGHSGTSSAKLSSAPSRALRVGGAGTGAEPGMGEKREPEGEGEHGKLALRGWRELKVGGEGVLEPGGVGPGRRAGGHLVSRTGEGARGAGSGEPSGRRALPGLFWVQCPSSSSGTPTCW